jgi:hypothetical protein
VTRKGAPLLVEEEDISATLEKGMRGREACETTTDYDDLCHEDRKMKRRRKRELSTLFR